MNVIIFLLIVTTVVELIVCKFSLWWIVSLICRVLFCCRIIGATLPVKKLAIAEAVNLSAMLLFNILFSKDGMPWLKILLYVLFTGFSLFLEYLDDILYVYVIEDEEDI